MAKGVLMQREMRVEEGASETPRYCDISSDIHVRRHVGKTRKAIQDTRRRRRSGLSGWQVKRVVEYVEERLDGPVRVSDLAAAAKLSPSHFTRAFSISLGISPYTFVMQQRIERAQSLLLTSGHEMADIAFACGLSDHAHFSRLFRRFVGTTPSKWRDEFVSRSAS